MPTLLILTIFLPLIGALALLATPRHDYRVARWTALVTVLVTALLSFYLAAQFEVGAPGPQFSRIDATSGDGAHHGTRWIQVGQGPGIRFALGLDGVSLSLFLLTTVLMVTAICTAWNSIQDRAPTFYALLLVLQSALLGIFSSLDVILFYIFFEFTLIPLFFLVGLFGGPQRKRASMTFFLYTLAGSLLTLLGVIALTVVHAQNSPEHVLSFSIPELTHGLQNLSWAPWRELSNHFENPGANTLPHHPIYSPQALIFLLLFAGFAIKLPLFPFHTWQPLTYYEAPTAVTVLLAGVLAKVGSYGFLRFNLGMTPLGTHYYMPMLATLSVIGIIYGALVALAQTDLKRMVAYSSFSHMGFIALGLFSLTAVGLDGATIQMVNHGITTAALLACVGLLYDRYHTHEMTEMSGLWQRLPMLAFFLILASLGSAAVPFLNGFVGEFPILLGQFSRNPFYAVLATIGMVLGAYYLLAMLERVLFGPLREPVKNTASAIRHGSTSSVSQPHKTHNSGKHHTHHHEHEHGQHGELTTQRLSWTEVLGLAPLMILIVGIGLFPKPIFDRIGPPLREISRGFYHPAGTAENHNLTGHAMVPTHQSSRPVVDRTGVVAHTYSQQDRSQ